MDFSFIRTQWIQLYHIYSMNKHRIRGKFNAFCFVFICLSHFDTRNSQLATFGLFVIRLEKFGPCGWCLCYISCCLSEYGNMDNVFAVSQRFGCAQLVIQPKLWKEKEYESVWFGLSLSLILCVNAMNLQRLNRYNAHILFIIDDTV